jgi:5-methylcytosine-specific restriction endonuclease McrA
MAEKILSVISREDARAQGLKRFFTGEPCFRGHSAERTVSSGACIPCQRMAVAKYRKADPERMKARWKKQNDGRKEQLKKWGAENRERKAAIMRAWRKANPERNRENNKRSKAHCYAKSKLTTIAWRRRNPDLVRIHYATKRAKRRKAEGKYTRRDELMLLERQRGRCANCGVACAKRYHIDHVIPLAKGGSNWPSNLQILCPTCNSRKSAKDPIEWARENGRLL